MDHRELGFGQLGGVAPLIELWPITKRAGVQISSELTPLNTVKLHKRGSFLQTAGHPYPLLLGQPSSALLSTAQASGPPSVEIGWATKTIIFEDVRGYKMTSFFSCKFFGQFAVQGFFSAHLY